MLSASISTANFYRIVPCRVCFISERYEFFGFGMPIHLLSWLAPGSGFRPSCFCGAVLQYGVRQRVCLDVRRALPPGQFPGRDGRAPRSESLRCGLLAAAAAGHCPHCMILPALHDKDASRRACSSCLLPPLFRGLSAPVRARYRIEFILMLALTSAIALMRLIATSLSAWCGFWLTSFTYPSRSDF